MLGKRGQWVEKYGEMGGTRGKRAIAKERHRDKQIDTRTDRQRHKRKHIRKIREIGQ